MLNSSDLNGNEKATMSVLFTPGTSDRNCTSRMRPALSIDRFAATGVGACFRGLLSSAPAAKATLVASSIVPRTSMSRLVKGRKDFSRGSSAEYRSAQKFTAWPQTTISPLSLSERKTWSTSCESRNDNNSVGLNELSEPTEFRRTRKDATCSRP